MALCNVTRMGRKKSKQIIHCDPVGQCVDRYQYFKTVQVASIVAAVVLFAKQHHPSLLLMSFTSISSNDDDDDDDNILFSCSVLLAIVVVVEVKVIFVYVDPDYGESIPY